MRLIFCAFLLAVVALVSCMPYGNDPEYAMVPDEDGSWKLVNINEDPEPERFYDPETDIIFTLFTRSTREGQVIKWNDPSTIDRSAFNPAHPTRITVHGWNGSPGARVNTAVHRSYFEVGDFNCITVDWTAGANTLNYLAARNRVAGTGVVAANLLRMIAIHTGADLGQMSAIGHSLGGHVVGFIGKNLQGRLGSIVALDPALPLFSINSPHARTNVGDAKYVEVFLTNAGLLGFDEPIGDSNFYPNWGTSQPGCGADLSGNCAHVRSHEFFAETIVSDIGFWSRRCRGYQDIVNRNCVSSGPDTRMGGEPLNYNANGVYWLETNEASPFAQGRIQG